VSDDELDFLQDCFDRANPAQPSLVVAGPADGDGDIDDFMDMMGGAAARPPPKSIADRTDAILTAYPDSSPEVARELATKAVESVIAFFLSAERSPREKSTLGVYLRQGYVTKQDCYDLGFDPVVTRDLTKHGIVFESRQGAIYLDIERSNADHGGPSQMATRRRDVLIEASGFVCNLCGATFEKKRLAVDHRIPHQIVGDRIVVEHGDAAFQVACYYCNNRKQQACRACPAQESDGQECPTCYWASPEDYTHVARVPERRLVLTAREPKHIRFLDVVQRHARKHGLL
jgi:hypothetical protein